MEAENKTNITQEQLIVLLAAGMSLVGAQLLLEGCRNDDEMKKEQGKKVFKMVEAFVRTGLALLKASPRLQMQEG